MTTLHVSKQFWKGGLLRIHKPIFADGKIKAEHLGQGHAVSLCPRQGEMSALFGSPEPCFDWWTKPSHSARSEMFPSQEWGEFALVHHTHGRLIRVKPATSQERFGCNCSLTNVQNTSWSAGQSDHAKHMPFFNPIGVCERSQHSAVREPERA